jgi:hypothetical protein
MINSRENLRHADHHLAVSLAACNRPFARAGGAFAQSAVCSGDSIGLDLSVEATPHVHMQLGGRSGNFLIDTGPAPTASMPASSVS